MKLEMNHDLLLALTHIPREVFLDDSHSKGVESSPGENVSSIVECRGHIAVVAGSLAFSSGDDDQFKLSYCSNKVLNWEGVPHAEFEALQGRSSLCAGPLDDVRIRDTRQIAEVELARVGDVEFRTPCDSRTSNPQLRSHMDIAIIICLL